MDRIRTTVGTFKSIRDIVRALGKFSIRAVVRTSVRVLFRDKIRMLVKEKVRKSVTDSVTFSGRDFRVLVRASASQVGTASGHYLKTVSRP